jgi:hypothetical protein
MNSFFSRHAVDLRGYDPQDVFVEGPNIGYDNKDTVCGEQTVTLSCPRESCDGEVEATERARLAYGMGYKSDSSLIEEVSDILDGPELIDARPKLEHSVATRVAHEFHEDFHELKIPQYSNVRGSVSTPQRVYHGTCATDEVCGSSSHVTTCAFLTLMCRLQPRRTAGSVTPSLVWRRRVRISLSRLTASSTVSIFQKGETIQAGLGAQKVMCLDISARSSAFPICSQCRTASGS